ncbi:MAG: hypothetical protein GDA54_02285 [Alphaproteobacteria bacterium GM7ARS4]|nr:hypothetical protein [Alphaproteobacteria bacterium GM7ARS4]
MRLLSLFRTRRHAKSAWEEWLDYQFTHKKWHDASWNREHPEFQRLEFVGDRILNMIISMFLYDSFPRDKEGELSRRCAYLASSSCLNKIGTRHHITPILFSANQNTPNIEKIKPERLVADAIEAAIGAVYLDGGMAHAKRLVWRLWKDDILNQPDTAPKDAKTALQEWTMKQDGLHLPLYNVVRKTQNTNGLMSFTVNVRVGSLRAKGQGYNVRQAEKDAAFNLISTHIKDIVEDVKQN